MKNYPRTFLFLFIIIALFWGPNAMAIEYRGFLDDLAHEFFRKGDVDGVIGKLLVLEEEYKGNNDFLNLVALAEIEVFRGEVKRAAELGSPEKHFEKALELARKALEIRESGRANRLAGEALSHLFDYRGVFFIIRNGGAARDYLEKALEMEDDIYMTQFIRGNYLINAPKIGGGDLEGGIKIFEEIYSQGHPVFNFLILKLKFDLAQNGKISGSPEEFLEKARDIFPESPWLEKFFKEN